MFVVYYLTGFRRACPQPATASETPDDDAASPRLGASNVRGQVRSTTFLVAFCFLPVSFVAFVFCFVCRNAVLSVPRSTWSPHLPMPQSSPHRLPELSPSNHMPVWTQ
jgi:hypothetical protein